MKRTFILLLAVMLSFSCKKEDKPAETGTSWSVQLDNSSRSFAAVEMTENAIYVLGNEVLPSGIGSKTLIYKSTDNGLSWNALSYDDGLYFSGIHFLNEDIGLLAGYRLTAKTMDGGLNWDTTHSGLRNFQSFCSPDNAKIFGYGTGVYVSMDTAKTWQMILPLSDAYTCMDFIDQEIGYTAQSSGKFHKTTNGGSSWDLVNDLGDTQWFFDIQFSTENKGIALIGEQDSPHAEPEMKLFYTLNGGLEWEELQLADNSIILNTTSCCFLESENEIYLGAVNGIFYSADLGVSWSNQYTASGNSWINDIQLKGSTGIATTSTGKILKH